ncbi:MAG: type II toxin-antitoxin system VapC family toxin [Candidatus Micrarchaeaceae archaeon]|jgi:tRNA(fMet)-specific endonuclease VapC
MLLDTSILIDILDGNSTIKSNLKQLNERSFTSVISKYELLKAPKEEDVKFLLNTMEIYDFEERAAERSARIFKDLKKKGKMINELDILIAAIAIANDELLVTRDNDFKNIEQLRLLVL